MIILISCILTAGCASLLKDAFQNPNEIVLSQDQENGCARGYVASVMELKEEAMLRQSKSEEFMKAYHTCYEKRIKIEQYLHLISNEEN